MLEINRMLMAMPKKKKAAPVTDELTGKKPSLKVVAKITSVFQGDKTLNELTALAGFSYPIVSTAIRYMMKYGDVIQVGGIRRVTGSNNLLSELKLAPHRSNMNMTGVSYNKKTNVFSCSYGRDIFLTFKSFLDAACARKSLEAQSWMYN